MADIVFRVRLRVDGESTNDFSITASTGYTGDEEVVVYNPMNTVITASGTTVDDLTSTPITLTEDEDSDVLAGDWRVVVDGTDTYRFTYANLDFTAVVRQTPNGFSSTFASKDISDYTGWTRVSRTHTITPPSTMSELTGAGEELSYSANIYSGEYESELAVDVKREITVTCTTATGELWVYDSDIDTETVNVYKIEENTVFDEAEDYFELYSTQLGTAPKTAYDKQPSLFKIGNALHQFSKALRGGDTETMYEQLLIVQETLNPDYLDETPDEEEIVPYTFTDIDHSHDNKTTILDLFTLVDGDLYFNEELVGTESNKVLASGTDGTAGYLDAKVDNTTIEVSSEKLAVKESYISGLAGDGLEWNAVTEKFDVTESGGGTTESDAVIEWVAGTYAAGRMVYTLSGVEETLWIANKETSSEPTVESDDWDEAQVSELAHTQNNDTRLGNVLLELSTTTNLDSYVLKVGGGDTEWYLYNNIRLTKDDTSATLYGIEGAVSELYDDIDLKNHDITVTFESSEAGDFTVADAVADSHVLPADTYGFNNYGNTITFSSTGDWARYRFNVDTEEFDLVATNLPDSVSKAETESGISLDDLSATEGAIDNDSVFDYNETTGVFTIDTDLSKWDNTTSNFLDASEFATEFNSNFGDANLANLATKNHGSLENLNSDLSNQHVSALEKTSWDEKQDEITGAATTIVDDDLTASRVLISNASGKVAVSDVTSTELGYLDDCSSNIQDQLDAKTDSFELLIPSGGSLATRIAGVILPSGWSLSTSGGGLDLEITHGRGDLVADVIVYEKDGGTGVRTKLTGANAYNTLTSDSAENVVTLTAFTSGENSKDNYLKILF